jgi:hypothetical protein
MTYRLEYATAEDRFFDFCLWEYMPIAPFDGKLRQSSMLFHSFDVTGVGERAFELVAAVRDGLGDSNTVWGVKKLGAEIAWEFYFYDYRRRERETSITKVLDIVRHFGDCRVPVNEKLPYFMFSIDIDQGLVSGSRGVDEIHMYIGNAGSTVSSGICYSLKEKGARLENLYYFFDAKEQMKEIVAKASCSAYFDDTRIDIDRILWPELRDCKVIVVANKQNNDRVYFSRINVDQLVFFLKRMAYPTEIWRFVEDHRSDLDHLLYDVGFDYRMAGDDVVILKSGYYGIF